MTATAESATPERRRNTKSGKGQRPRSELDPTFGDWLRRMRLNKGYNVKDFAERCGVHTGTITAFELGRQSGKAISTDLFVRLADALDMDLGYVLHKAGFDIGAGGIKIGRVQRVENAADAFVQAEPMMRSALAEAMHALEDPDTLTGARADEIVAQLGRTLGNVDFVATRMRAEGFGNDRPRYDTQRTGQRQWSDQDDEFLAAHPDLSNQELAELLGRSPDGVRARRNRHTPEEAK